jgi:predicted SAM-dependent methyltransferase
MIDFNHPYSIFSKEYAPSWTYMLRFEIISRIGRIFFQRRPPDLYSERLLHLGCGPIIFNDWINADFFKVRFWITPKNGWSLDLRYPFKCYDNYWDGVFTEHTLEHLLPIENLALFKELYRTMKPNAWIRICVPGLEQHLSLFNNKSLNKEESEFKSLFSTKAEAIYSLTQNWGHRSVWNGELMTELLKMAGFRNSKEVSFGVGSDKRLIKDAEDRKVGSLYVEAQK